MNQLFPQVLALNGLSVEVTDGQQQLVLVDDLNLTISRGETLCLVGESGCGKSLTALSLLGLCPHPCQVFMNSLQIDGINITHSDSRSLSALRGDRLSAVFQDPMSALNPLLTIKRQMTEGFLKHDKGSRREALEKAEYLLDRVGISDPETRLRQYPHQLSGGQRQRVLIAMALMCDPAVLVADEPTTALDTTTQLQILQLFRELQSTFNLGVLFITHDLGVVAHIGDRVAVMYAGQIVETGPVKEVLQHPAHPYTQSLLSCIPRLEPEFRQKLPPSIPGIVPSPTRATTGCHFYRRCKESMDECREGPIRFREIGHTHNSRCLLTRIGGLVEND
jgi:peptide/nickel transport system ATP-binding protein